jgi:GAF domain-containing protein
MEPLFDSADDPRWRLLEVAGDRLAMAASQAEIVEIVRSAARGVCSADGVTFVLREYSFCHYVEEDAIGPLWKGQKFPMTSCISGWAMLNKKAAVIPDIFADDRIPHDLYRKTFVKSLIMSPIGMNTPMAAMGTYWRDLNKFSPREIAAVETLASHVSQAMTRVHEAA